MSATAALLTLATAPCLWAVSRGSAHERLAGLSLANTLVTAVFLLIAQGFGRSFLVDLALVLALLGPAGTLVFARFLGARSLDAAEASDTASHGET
ncbi:monovalent cation/H+ antiporter complex subunit F [Streptomyces beihaiensis]|uniref:Monovalent cation/H+ antiporter complex subunit F n=1 Tax=Streptomyces beihaiensis TaxID=2984495 RepID=A0ABT3TR43_9ACTN|nr:monovalent cation/H+ antiporter complex subunit F [Streptomyces beihaiensis]MCX3058570.1 monovalent cation/H+ antiporter complex subunit F [Streptomyces beihaiensis]